MTGIDNFINAQGGLWYARYRDDFLLSTRTRWQLRRSVKRLHEFFDLGGFETHPDKTQLGRIEQGFDWLGVWFTPTGATIAPRALENHLARRARLYEQARRQGLSSTETAERVRTYEARWTSWAEHMLDHLLDDI
ncbi:reverse transcriptase [compost metagenome]